MIKVCENCGNNFKSIANRGRFCSKRCYWDSNIGVENKKIQKRITKSCAICNKDFVVRECHSHVVTCSIKCGGIYRRGSRHEIVERVNKKCNGCKKQMRLTQKEASRKKFCTRDCYLSYRTRNSKYPQKARLQSSKWIKVRKKVLERDKRCCFCGKEKDNLHAHHKVPFAQSNDNSLDNLILLCASCHYHIHRMYDLLEDSGMRIVSSKESGEYEPNFKMFA